MIIGLLLTCSPEAFLFSFFAVVLVVAVVGSIAAISVLVWAIAGMTCGFLDDDKGTMQPPSRVARR